MTALVPMLCERFGLPSADLEAVVKCEHKYWSGVQAATEGYVYRGQVTVNGALDSIDYPDTPCFLRHQYPSQLPPEIVARMTDISERVITQMGLDNSTFSIEFFCEPETGRVSVLEINARHSQSHADMFYAVDGVPNHHCMVRLGLGLDPRLPKGQGRYDIAAKCYYRRFSDGIVTGVPTAAEIERIQDDIPGVTIEVVPAEGIRLSKMPAQDSYSYELADIFIGADSEADLVAKYERCVDALRFEFDDVDDEANQAQRSPSARGADDEGHDGRHHRRHPGVRDVLDSEIRCREQAFEVAIGVAAVREASLQRCQHILDAGAQAGAADVFVEQEPAAGPQHAMHLAQRPGRVAHRAEHQRRGDGVETGRREIQPVRVAVHDGDGPGEAVGACRQSGAQCRIRFEQDEFVQAVRVMRDGQSVAGPDFEGATGGVGELGPAQIGLSGTFDAGHEARIPAGEEALAESCGGHVNECGGRRPFASWPVRAIIDAG